MTMLDRMRQRKNWLKWSLGLVCLAFVAFYIPDFLHQHDTAVAAPNDVLADVEGRQITVAEFHRAYHQQLEIYGGAYGGNLSEQVLRQMGLDRQVLQQLVDEQAALEEAARLGLDVTDVEVRERIVALPGFQENGAFVGEERYKQILRVQRPPMTHVQFEESLRRSLLLAKLQRALTEWMTVTDAEIEEEFLRRNEQVKLELVTFLADAFRPDVTVTDAEVEEHFDANASSYRIPEKRRIRFLAIDTQALRAQVFVSPQDVERAYNDGIDQYTIPEQVRASHILLLTEGKDETAVRQRAETILAEARTDADFAALAMRYSEDEASRTSGGDLDFFTRGRMVPEFEQVAFSMEPGRLSDLVQTTYGFHIIKVTDKRDSQVRPLEDVRQQIVEQITSSRAQARADQISRELAPEIDEPDDLDHAASSRGLTVQESELFAIDEPVLGLGSSPEVATEAFRMLEGEVAGPLRAQQGYAFIVVTGTQDAYVPQLDEVTERVRDDVIRQKATDLALRKATEVAPALKNATDFSSSATRAGLEPKTTLLIVRGSPIPDIGASQEIDRVAFSLAPGLTSDPIATPDGVAIIRVVERTDSSPDELAAAGDALREELLGARRNRFFSAYMAKAKERMRIDINGDTLQLVGGLG